MAVDTTQLIADAQCIFACVPPGMLPAAQLAQMAAPSIVTTTVVAGQTGAVVPALAANPRRRWAILQNQGASIGVIGDASVTAANGVQLAAFSASNPNCQIIVNTQGALFWAGTTGQNLNVMEFLVP